MADRGCNYYKTDPAAFLKGLKSSEPLTQEEMKIEANQVNKQVEPPPPAPQPEEAPPPPQMAFLIPVFDSRHLVQLLSNQLEARWMDFQHEQGNRNGEASAASGEATGNNNSANPTNGNSEVLNTINAMIDALE